MGIFRFRTPARMDHRGWDLCRHARRQHRLCHRPLWGRPLLDRYQRFFRIQPATLKRGEEMFACYGAAAVFSARFIFGLRIFAGPLAGVLRMRWRAFAVFNFLGAALWVTCIASLRISIRPALAHSRARHAALQYRRFDCGRRGDPVSMVETSSPPYIGARLTPQPVLRMVTVIAVFAPTTGIISGLSTIRSA